MGAEIQYSMYVPGFHSTTNLSNGTVNGRRSLHHESRTFSRYSDFFSSSPAMSGYMPYEKDQLRQTILKQERTFRHQVNELHRLYKVQKDMMNEVRHINPLRHSKTEDMSGTTFCGKLSPNEQKMWHDSASPSADLNYHMTSLLGAAKLQTHHNSMNSKTMQSDCISLSKLSRFADDESQKKLQRRLFDLEVPADEYKSDEEELQRAYGGSGFESCPSYANSKVNDERNNIGDKLSSNAHTRGEGSLNLNEPIQIDETSVTTSAGIVSNTCFSKGKAHGSLQAGHEKGHEADGNHMAKRKKSIIFGVEISEIKEHYSDTVGSASSNGICDSNSASEPITQQSATDENKVAGWLVNRKSAENVSAMSEPQSGTYQSSVKDPLSGKDACIAKDGGNSSSNGKSHVVSVFGKNIMENLPSASPASMATSSAPDDSKSTKTGPFQSNLDHDFLPSESKEEHSLNDVVERNSVCSDKERWHIDLNLSMIEDEVQIPKNSVTANMKNVVEIDLEVPAVDEVDMMMSSASEPLGGKSREHVSLDIESESAGEEYIKLAAEALLAISYDAHVSEDDATSHESKASLQWFAEVISLYYDCTESMMAELANKDVHDCEDSSDEFDYFEHMTLQLSETKEEIHPYKTQVVESTEEDTTASRRPRRGPARRGRQRKDFQRDVLPGLVSLAINDVTEDLHMLEGLVRATGGSWQSSLSMRTSSKSRGRRGRKRSVASTAASLTVTPVSPPQPAQQPKCAELGTEETRLSGWGRRSRRPPRQRYQINNPQPVQ